MDHKIKNIISIHDFSTKKINYILSVSQEVYKNPDKYTDLFIENLLICNNPNCISNIENINSKFHNIDLEKIDLVCHYCEKKQNEIKIKK